MTSNPRFVCYYRVSTQQQGRSGLGLDAQRSIVATFLKGAIPIAEFTEVETGKGSNALAKRPQLREALITCQKKRAVLVIAALDRLARNVNFISGLMESGVEFRVANLPDATPFMVNIYASVAEEEGRRISERISQALQAKKQRGEFLGSKNIVEVAKLGVTSLKKSADGFASNVLPIIREIQGAGIKTLEGIAGALNARGVRTPRGRQWYPSSVRNLLLRARPTKSS